MLKRFKICSNHLLFYLSIPSLQNTSTEKSKTTLQLRRLHSLGVSKTPLHDSTPPFSTCPERTGPIRTKHYKGIKISQIQPFHLTFMAGIIRKCYGYEQAFSERYRNAPNDLVLKRYDHRIYLGFP
jgi:hypothetical protein